MTELLSPVALRQLTNAQLRAYHQSLRDVISNMAVRKNRLDAIAGWAGRRTSVEAGWAGLETFLFIGGVGSIPAAPLLACATIISSALVFTFRTARPLFKETQNLYRVCRDLIEYRKQLGAIKQALFEIEEDVRRRIAQKLWP